MCLIKGMYWSRGTPYMNKKCKSHVVYRCGFSSGHQTFSSLFIPGWLVLLLQVKTQHPQNSVHEILFLRQLHLPSYPLLHTARKQNVLAQSMHQRADHCNFLALLVHPGSHRYKTWMSWSTSLWFCQQIYQTRRSLSKHEHPTVQKRAFVLSFVYVTDRNVSLQPIFSSEKDCRNWQVWIHVDQ